MCALVQERHSSVADNVVAFLQLLQYNEGEIYTKEQQLYLAIELKNVIKI
jgi:hypothetical protein